MKFNWSEYLTLARQLAGKETNPASEEAKLRAAASRAYYAAFIKARNFLRDGDGLVIPRKSTHQYVIKQFKSSPDRARKKIGRRLERLRDYRVLADYQDAVSELPDKTEEALTLARRIIAGLDGL